MSETKLCIKCNQEKPYSSFRVQRSNSKYPYRLRACQDCRRQQQYDAINRSSNRYIVDRWQRLKVRCKRLEIPFTITKEYLISLFNQQSGKCFYTDIPLRCRVGEGYSNDAFSIDRVVPELGYVPNNVVLCTYRANAIKRDLTLEELKLWIPGWYSKILQLLPALGTQ